MVDDLPVPGLLRRRHPLRPQLGLEQRRLRRERVAVRVVRPGRHRHRVDLVDGVGRPVEGEVEPVAEHVLVMRPGQLGRDRVRVRHPLARAHRLRLDDAGQLHLGLDRPVEVEVPEEAVLVVAHGGDRGDDHPPRPAGLAPGSVRRRASRGCRSPLRAGRWRCAAASRCPRRLPGRRPGRRSRPGSRSRAPASWRTARARTRRRRTRSSTSGSSPSTRRARPSPTSTRGTGSAAAARPRCR